MASTSIVLCDTNVVIEFYKNNTAIVAELRKIGQANLAVSFVTAGELIYGAINKRELQQILKDLAHLIDFHANEDICRGAVSLMEKYSLSHKLTLPDALIAATALYYDLPLYTLNLKDFRFIPNLKFYQ
ncbi:MAG: type II toxin-antitoxin system VapC family toxin [Saprospiraceae bacterium]|nr:type II toxin-antitoxin system VapC family toxin [Saprospiraceae bacterium]